MAVIVEPIKCHKCGNIVVKDKRNLMHMVLTKDIRCKKCNTVVVKAPPQPIW